SEEGSTSRWRFLDLEQVGKQAVYAGRRVARGLFRSGDGRCRNADVDGALTIPRAGVPDALGTGRGCRGSPRQDGPAAWAAWQRCPCGLQLCHFLKMEIGALSRYSGAASRVRLVVASSP